MNSQIIVEKYGATLRGQQLLFPDPDIILRKTKFQKVDPEFDKEAVVHWWMNVYLPDGYNEEETPMDVYSSWSSAVYRYFRHVKIGGHYLETNQTAIDFAGYKKEPLEPQVEELSLWIPHIKPIKNTDREGKRIKVFEHTLSEGGVWDVWIYSDTEYVLGFTRYGRYEERAKFESLGKCCGFITQHCWYQKHY